MNADMSTAQEELSQRLRALLPTIDGIDPTEGPMAAEMLEQVLPFDGPEVKQIRALCETGMEAGWLTPRAAGPSVKFGRIDKDMGGYAVDAVLMENGTGMGHTHTRGEVNMCFEWEGEPKFDGLEPGWVVFAPGSHHVPTVTGGTMLFIYFTPGGEVVWDKA